MLIRQSKHLELELHTFYPFGGKKLGKRNKRKDE